jgi:hypothetical protein
MRSPGVAKVFCALFVSVAGCTAAVAQQPAQSSAALPNPVAAQSFDELSATLERPLFSPSRHPPSPPPPPLQAAEAPAPPPSPPNLVLLGVVMDGDGARAVVRLSADGKILRAQIGDDIDGWKVSQIEGRKMVLSLDGRFATFALFSRDREKQDAVGGPMPGGAPKNSTRQNEVQQATAQAVAPPSGQPIRQRRSR